MSFVCVLLLVCQGALGAGGAGPPRPGPADVTVDDAMHVRRAPPPPRDQGTMRWIDVSTATVGLRYRTLASGGRPGMHQVQMAAAFRGRFKLDREGRLAVHAGIGTGRGFRGGWNSTGIGTGAFARDAAAKDFYLSAARGDRRFELLMGGFPFLRGEATEATTYDNDGAIIGARVSVRPGRLVDELSFTRAYLGDLDQADVIRRLGRLDRANYYQVLATRRIGRAGLSMEYTAESGADIVRSAVSLSLQGIVPLDRVRFEHALRVSAPTGAGFAVAVQRQLSPHAMAAAGLSRLDEQAGRLNGDFYGSGTRMFGSVSRRFRDQWLASAQMAFAVGRSPSGPKVRLDAGLAVDLARAWAGRGRQGGRREPWGLPGPSDGPRRRAEPRAPAVDPSASGVR